MVSQSESPTRRPDIAPADEAALRRWERLRVQGRASFVWRNGVFSELTALNGSASSVAYDVDSRGCVVGYSATVNGETHATLWCEGQTTDLGALPGAAFSQATGINERGQIVGWSYNSAFEPHAILWQDGEIIDLGTLPGGSASFAIT